MGFFPSEMTPGPQVNGSRLGGHTVGIFLQVYFFLALSCFTNFLTLRTAVSISTHNCLCFVDARFQADSKNHATSALLGCPIHSFTVVIGSRKTIDATIEETHFHLEDLLLDHQDHTDCPVTGQNGFFFNQFEPRLC